MPEIKSNFPWLKSRETTLNISNWWKFRCNIFVRDIFPILSLCNRFFLSGNWNIQGSQENFVNMFNWKSCEYGW